MYTATAQQMIVRALARMFLIVPAIPTLNTPAARSTG
jgi:hypothetical protein